MKGTRAPWRKETDGCAWTRLETEKERTGLKGAAVEGEVAGAAGAAVEEASRVIVVDAPETVAGVVGVE